MVTMRASLGNYEDIFHEEWAPFEQKESAFVHSHSVPIVNKQTSNTD